MFKETERPKAGLLTEGGFTSMELLVVIVIFGLLAAYVGPRYFAQLGKTEQKTANVQIEFFGKALDAYRLDIARYPASDAGLDALVVKPADESKWQGPYLQNAVPAVPWGRPYTYRSFGQAAEFALMSFEKNGQAGGDGDNADIVYR